MEWRTPLQTLWERQLLLCLLESFLADRQQRVVFNGELSNWENVKRGVPQGSVLGPFLFLIYINELCQGLCTNTKLFADDMSPFSVVDNIYESVITT